MCIFTDQMTAVRAEIKERRLRQLNEDLDGRLLYQAKIVDYVNDCIDSSIITRLQLKDLILDDRNLFSSEDIKAFIEKNYFTHQDLIVGGIPEGFVRLLRKRRPQPPAPSQTAIKKIPSGTTEVYMWGLPSSGKTCLLGAMMAAANSGSSGLASRILMGDSMQYGYNICQTFRYDKSFIYLPGRTPDTFNFAVETEIKDRSGRTHHITFVDMSGELFCDLNSEARVADGQHLSHIENEQYRTAREEFNNFFVSNKSDNPRFHIFIIEGHPGTDPSVDDDLKYKGITQFNYLQNGINYLESRSHIDPTRDRMFLAVTKSDLLPASQEFKNWLETWYSSGHWSIFQTGGRTVPITAGLDIGEVCFQDLCHFDMTQPLALLRQILIANSVNAK